MRYKAQLRCRRVSKISLDAERPCSSALRGPSIISWASILGAPPGYRTVGLSLCCDRCLDIHRLSNTRS